MTLWLPMLNYARSDAPQVRAVVAVLGQPRCVLAHRLSRSQVAALQYHGPLTLVPAEKIADCTWLVVGGNGKFPRHLDADQWLLQARIARPTDKTDALVLYRKSY